MITHSKLDQLINDQIIDQNKINEIITSASNNYAEIIDLKVGSKGAITFRVNDINGHNRSKWWNLNEAINCTWGNTKILMGQSTLYSFMKSAFPSFKWKYNDRTLLGGNLEIDILGEEKGKYIAVEFQGHQSHRSDIEVIDRDIKKKEIFENRKLGHWIVVNPPKRYTMIELKKQLDDAFAQQAPTYRTNIESLDLNQELKQLPITTAQLLESRYEHIIDAAHKSNKNHQIINNKASLIIGEEIKYQCGHCGRNATLNQSYLNDFPLGCSNSQCKSVRMQACHQLNRKIVYKNELGTLWNDLSTNLQNQLIQNTSKDGIQCLNCKNSNHIGDSLYETARDIKASNGYFCWFCLNTENTLTDSSALAGTIKQSYKAIVKIIRLTKMGSVDEWNNYISLAPARYNQKGQEIELSLRCKNTQKETKKTLSEWTNCLKNSKIRIMYDSWCDCCGAGDGNFKPYVAYKQEIQKSHPNGYLVNRTPDRNENVANKNQTKTYNCGESLTIGRSLVLHPNFRARTDRMNNHKGPYCFICDDNVRFLTNEHCEKNAPSVSKTLELIRAWWLNRAIIVGLLSGSTHYINASVEVVNNITKLENIISTTKVSLVFHCGNETHSPIKSNFDNMKNKAKNGMCPLCLKSLHGKKIKYAQLKEFYKQDIAEILTQK
ncbi:hypothetical protein PVK63_16400 [Aliivibrio sp. S2TY2]|uniref:hypothetical protein n=1 Tax=unclassified Aliivibrio TaxID=2645654 RepID=UPI002378DC4F|nr:MULTISPECIES: hypothetical protein [unclassified Aliivibrio]MDD9176451.1 hypothetical protein [Aliivibrio sp. S3TY1]MDD9193529.1 hypothetical protein [Aliivibrio sp. S2TY2]